MILRLVLLAVLAFPACAWAQDKERRPGVGIDAAGGQVIDPTKNVLDLVLAAVTRLNDLMAKDQQRQDDLREATKELIDARLAAMKELDQQRAMYNKELLKAAVDRLDSEARLRAEYAATIQATEKERVNAIRTVDTGAVAIASERANATANALAKTVADSAQTLSTLVASTAAETNRNVQQQFTALSTRIAALETGSSGIAGAGAGSAATIAYVISGLVLLISIGGLITSIIIATRRRPGTERNG